MSNLKRKSSNNSLSSRKPFEPISHTWEIPAALYELRQLATDGETKRLLELLDSIIITSGSDSKTWLDIPRQSMANGGI